MLKHLRGGLLWAILGVVCAGGSGLRAATLMVTNANDSGPGSLRDAVAIASWGDEIRFEPALSGIPIKLTSGQIVIDKDLAIVGLGKEFTIILGSPWSPFPQSDVPSRILNITAGVSVTIDSLRLVDGHSGYSEGGGGAVLNQGNLAIRHSKVNGVSRGGCGGGVSNSGDLLLIDSEMTGIAADIPGGGGGLCNSGRIQGDVLRFL
jgi:hypothetical protein